MRKICIIIGIIFFLLGSYQGYRYETVGIRVDGIITNVKSKDDTDDGPTSYKHTYYGYYEVDGEKYENKVLATKYTSSHKPDYSKGDKIELVVNPNNPKREMAEGGFFCMAGFLIILFGIFGFRKKKSDNVAEEDV